VKYLVALYHSVISRKYFTATQSPVFCSRLALERPHNLPCDPTPIKLPRLGSNPFPGHNARNESRVKGDIVADFIKQRGGVRIAPTNNA
jgi:hypothetical protein